jgi:cell division protease FtsH
MIFGQKEELVFLGREIGEQRDYSEHVAEQIDAEVRQIVGDAYDRIKTLLIDNRDKLDRVAQRLLEVETISQEEFLELMGETVSAGSSEPPEPTVSKPSNKPVDANTSEEYPGGALGPAPNPAR